MKKLFDWMDSRKMFSHILMLGIGGYLLYAVYMMLGRMDEMQGSRIPVYIAIVVFVVLGVLMVILGGLALYTGHYADNYAKKAMKKGGKEHEEAPDEEE